MAIVMTPFQARQGLAESLPRAGQIPALRPARTVSPAVPSSLRPLAVAPSAASPALDTRSALAAGVEEAAQREVLRCEHCNLVQFRTASDACRRCRKSLVVEVPKVAVQPAAETAADAATNEGPQVAAAVRDLRRVRNLSQRQLASRMNVPRTYISKIENGKAMPTLSSLDRLARALNVDISALLRDAPTRHKDESAVLLSDPFLAEIAKYSQHLDATQKSIFLNHVREIAQSRTRRTA